VKKQQPWNVVEQSLLLKPYHQVVCKLAHSIPMAKYFRRDKTISRITHWFYRPTVFYDVAKYCQSCPECQRTAGEIQLKVPLVPLLAMDIAPHSRRGNQYILAICDYANRQLEAISLCSINAGTVAERLIQEFAFPGRLGH